MSTLPSFWLEASWCDGARFEPPEFESLWATGMFWEAQRRDDPAADGFISKEIDQIMEAGFWPESFRNLFARRRSTPRLVSKWLGGCSFQLRASDLGSRSEKSAFRFGGEESILGLAGHRLSRFII